MSSTLASDLQAIEVAWNQARRRTTRIAAGIIAGLFALPVVVGLLFGFWPGLMLVFVPLSLGMGLDRTPFEIFGLFRKGLVPSRPKWMSIALGNERLDVSFRGRQIDVPLAAIVDATWTFDDQWYGINGVDDVLRLRVRDCGELIVPESAGGYKVLRDWLDDHVRLERIPV